MIVVSASDDILNQQKRSASIGNDLSLVLGYYKYIENENMLA